LQEAIQKLKNLLTKRDKQFLAGLFLLSVFISMVETIGITAIMPFISVATDFSLIHSNKYYAYANDLLNISNDVSFIIAFGALLISFYIFRSAVNLFYLYTLSRFAQGRYHLLAYRLFENYMGMSYKDFTNKNSSVLTKSIVTEAGNLTTLISSLLLMMSEVFIIIFLYTMLLYVNYKITLLLTILLVVNAIFMMKTVSVKIKKAGIIRNEMLKQFYEIINRSFENFKLIKLQSNDDKILNEFSIASYGNAKANITNGTLGQIPRLFLEAFGFSIIIFIIMYLVNKYDSDISAVLPVVTMFVLALYRLMPSVNRIMTGYNQVMFYSKSLDIIHNDLMYNSEELGNQEISFNIEIVLNNICFEYEENKRILENIILKIKKGDKIAFIGESGSGKSTLVDIITGLYKPLSGEVIVDNNIINDSNVKVWRSKVGYIPQSVYLFDGTVGENVAFGSDYNVEKIDDCLKKAKIYNFLKTKEGRETFVGEGGIMLSGGQKQRIAIARALYTEPEILVLDEATSALDDETEAQIMDEIYEVSRDKTLIIIAHRLSTIERCEKVYKLENGRIGNG